MAARGALTCACSPCVQVSALVPAFTSPCVYVCVLRANTVIAGGNQIGYDLGWQVLRAIVITPVSVNHISLYVLSHTLPT